MGYDEIVEIVTDEYPNLTTGKKYIIAAQESDGRLYKVINDDGHPQWVKPGDCRLSINADELTLRDQFAMSVPSALVDGLRVKDAAKLAYDYADAMLAERVK